MAQEIRGMPKQRIKKSEPLQTAQAAVTCEPGPRAVREATVQQRGAEPCVQAGLAEGATRTHTCKGQAICTCCSVHCHRRPAAGRHDHLGTV